MYVKDVVIHTQFKSYTKRSCPLQHFLFQDSVDFGHGQYMTIHITPESEFSYVSFETNVPLTSYLGVIQRVLDTFLPGKFILTVFANRVSSDLYLT